MHLNVPPHETSNLMKGYSLNLVVPAAVNALNSTVVLSLVAMQFPEKMSISPGVKVPDGFVQH
jgi:hypothetical protein